MQVWNSMSLTKVKKPEHFFEKKPQQNLTFGMLEWNKQTPLTKNLSTYKYLYNLCLTNTIFSSSKCDCSVCVCV